MLATISAVAIQTLLIDTVKQNSLDHSFPSHYPYTLLETQWVVRLLLSGLLAKLLHYWMQSFPMTVTKKKEVHEIFWNWYTTRASRERERETESGCVCKSYPY